jgi:YHS domain-containing protein
MTTSRPGRRTAVLLVAAAGLVAILGPSPARAGKPAVYTGFLSSLALNGHDPVAYFTEGRPVAGSASFQTRYNGATWRFVSAANQAAFEADPTKYAPQFGGYCAWAVSQGYTAKGDPAHWRIVDGKLYLNYDANVQATWEKDIPGFIRAAEGNWPKVIE